MYACVRERGGGRDSDVDHDKLALALQIPMTSTEVSERSSYFAQLMYD